MQKSSTREAEPDAKTNQTSRTGAAGTRILPDCGTIFSTAPKVSFTGRLSHLLHIALSGLGCILRSPQLLEAPTNRLAHLCSNTPLLAARRVCYREVVDEGQEISLPALFLSVNLHHLLRDNLVVRKMRRRERHANVHGNAGCLKAQHEGSGRNIECLRGNGA